MELIAILALVAFALSSGGSSVAGKSPGMLPGDGAKVPPPVPVASFKKPNHDYIDELYAIQLAELPRLKTYWHKDRLRLAAIAAGGRTGVPPEVIWGVMFRESNHKPVGIFSGSPAAAKAVGPTNPDTGLSPGSSAFGMGQILSRRFRNEKKQHPARFPFEHAHMIDPRYAMEAIGQSYRRGQSKNGPIDPDLVPSWVGDWWAGQGAGSRKTADVQKYGPDVWTEEGTGPLVDSDAEPPPGVSESVGFATASA